jgi:hypothetical protein
MKLLELLSTLVYEAQVAADADPSLLDCEVRVGSTKQSQTWAPGEFKYDPESSTFILLAD